MGHVASRQGVTSKTPLQKFLKKLETLQGESAVSTRDGTNAARDFPKRTQRLEAVSDEVLARPIGSYTLVRGGLLHR
jgi:hypothetical protein